MAKKKKKKATGNLSPFRDVPRKKPVAVIGANHMLVRWTRDERTRFPYVKRIEFCCLAMAKRWNRFVEFGLTTDSPGFGVAFCADFAGRKFHEAATQHAAAAAIAEVSGEFLDYEEIPVRAEYQVVAHHYCSVCGAEIVVEELKNQAKE